MAAESFLAFDSHTRCIGRCEEQRLKVPNWLSDRIKKTSPETPCRTCQVEVLYRASSISSASLERFRERRQLTMMKSIVSGECLREQIVGDKNNFGGSNADRNH